MIISESDKSRAEREKVMAAKEVAVGEVLNWKMKRLTLKKNEVKNAERIQNRPARLRGKVICLSVA